MTGTMSMFDDGECEVIVLQLGLMLDDDRLPAAMVAAAAREVHRVWAERLAVPDGVFAPSPPDVGMPCECGHDAASHWVGGPAGNRVGCEAPGCRCGE